MKIDSIRITNFKGIEKLETGVAKLNVITGPNGSGKSSALEAIRVGLTGRTAADTVKTNAPSGGVTLKLEKLGLLARTWEFGSGKSKITLNDKTTTAKSVTEMMKSLFNISPETANIATSSGVMLGLSSGDFSKYLLQEGFMKIQTDIDQLSSLCALTPEAEEELRNYLPCAPDPITPADIDEAHSYYFELRAAQRKEHAEASAKAKYTGVVPKRQVQEITKEQALTLEESGKIKSQTENYKTMQKNYEAHKKSLDEAREQMNKIDCKRPNEKHIETLTEQLAQSRKAATDNSSTIKVLEGNVSSLRKVLAGLGTSKCPISDKLTCTTDKTSVQGEVSESIESSEKKLAELRLEKETNAKKEEELSDLLEAERQNSLLYQKKLQLIQQVEALEKTDIKQPQEVDASQLPAIQSRLEILSEELTLATSYAKSLAAKKKADAAEKLSLLYDEITKALAPKSGIRQVMMESSAAPLAAHLNEQLNNLLPGRSVSIDTSDGFTVKVGDDAGGVISFDSASTSERTKIAIALFDMLNALSGFRIMMIDNTDSFDAESLGLVLDYVQDEETLDRYDSIFIAGVSNAELESAISGISNADCQIIRL